MEFLTPVIKIIHIVVSLLLVLIILLQPSKSGDIGSMFGGGSSESVFGSSGAVPFLVKMTRLLGLVFVVTSLSLGYFSVKSIKGSVVKDPPAAAVDQSFETTEIPSEESDGERASEASLQGSEEGPEAEPGSEPERRSSHEIAPVEKADEPGGPGDGAEK